MEFRCLIAVSCILYQCLINTHHKWKFSWGKCPFLGWNISQYTVLYSISMSIKEKMYRSVMVRPCSCAVALMLWSFMSFLTYLLSTSRYEGTIPRLLSQVRQNKTAGRQDTKTTTDKPHRQTRQTDSLMPTASTVNLTGPLLLLLLWATHHAMATNWL